MVRVVRRGVALFAGAGLFALMGCASKPPEVPEIAMAQTSLSDAERAGALRDAPEELHDGRAKVGLAEDARQHGHGTEAEYLASEALADGKLAMVKAQAKQQELGVAQQRQDMDALRGEPVATPGATIVPSSPQTYPSTTTMPSESQP